MIVGIGELLWDFQADGTATAGGAPFNFAFHCQQLGHESTIVSRVGDDELGEKLRAEVRSLGLSDAYIQVDSKHPTGTVQVDVDATGQPSYSIAENVAWDHIMPTDELVDLAHRTRCVCYGSLGYRSPRSAETIHRFRRLQRLGLWGTWSVCDINLRQNFFNAESIDSAVRFADWLKLNSEEASRLAEVYGRAGEPMIPFLKGLLNLGTDNQSAIIWTHGADGCDVFTSDAEYSEAGVPAQVVDTVGAGDAFTAAMVCLRIEGKSLAESLPGAMKYAARVCEHRGGTPRINRRELFS